MSRPDPLLFALQKLTVDFSLIDRNHYLANTDRRENDSEHTLSVALLCWFIHDRYRVDLDISKILKYAIAHDLVEVYAGDVNTFATKEERDNKVVREKQALEQLSEELTRFGDLVNSMQKYETKADAEALFVWTVDKMQALIMGDIDGWRPYRELEISYSSFCEKYEEQLSNCSPYCEEIFRGLIDYCKTTYYDKPSA